MPVVVVKREVSYLISVELLLGGDSNHQVAVSCYEGLEPDILVGQEGVDDSTNGECGQVSSQGARVVDQVARRRHNRLTGRVNENPAMECECRPWPGNSGEGNSRVVIVEVEIRLSFDSSVFSRYLLQTLHL